MPYVKCIVCEKEFYANNPNAQDITALPNVYKAFEKQENLDIRTATPLNNKQK